MNLAFERCFCVVAGHFGKFELVLVGLVSNVDALSDILGCRVSKLPMTYLGLPLGSTFKERELCGMLL